MSNFQSQLTLKIEAENRMLQEHQQTLMQFQQQSLTVFENIAMNLKDLETNVTTTTENITQLNSQLIESLKLSVHQSSAFQVLLLEQLQEIDQLAEQLQDQKQSISTLAANFQSAQTLQSEQNTTIVKDLSKNQKVVNILRERLDSKLETILENIHSCKRQSFELILQQQSHRKIQTFLIVLILTLFTICVLIF